MAREDAKTVGMFGSGGMARSHMESFRLVRPVKKLKVYSPTRENREVYAREMEKAYGIEAVALDNPEDVYKDVDILCSCTDASVPVILGKHIRKGTHITSIGGRPDAGTFDKIDRFLRFGNATPPFGQDEPVVDEFLRYVTPKMGAGIRREHKHARGVVRQMAKERVVYLKDILAGGKGRLTPDDITYSERGNLQGAQFHAVAGKVYELAREQGLGREIPTEWFLQDIRD
jgi:ornithine cyclodeaminase/alanine dehydrogenase-like protein (mu-crystallin family)